MTKQESFRIGMALHKIAMSVDDETLKTITPFIAEIEGIVLAQPIAEDKESE